KTLAAHYTHVARRTTTTVETVRFQRPHRVSFRLVRGPVPHVVESYELRATTDGTQLRYSGELGTDLWQFGRWWGDRVATPWERAVQQSLRTIRQEAERRAARGHATMRPPPAPAGDHMHHRPPPPPPPTKTSSELPRRAQPSPPPALRELK